MNPIGQFSALCSLLSDSDPWSMTLPGGEGSAGG